MHEYRHIMIISSQSCQPGRVKKSGTCVFCPEGTHNPSGSDQCTPCEPNTISLKGNNVLTDDSAWKPKMSKSLTLSDSEKVVTSWNRKF